MDWLYLIATGGYILYKAFLENEGEPDNDRRPQDSFRKATSYSYVGETLLNNHVEADKSKAFVVNGNESRRTFKTSKECFEKEYVSYSRIATYCVCPQRFKLIYLDKCEPSSEFSFYYTRGATFHRAVEGILRMRLLDSNRILTELDYKEIVNEGYKLGYLERSRTLWPEYKRARNREKTKRFRNIAKFFCKTLPVNVEIVAIEKELRFKVGGINFFGIVDLVLKYPDGHIEIIDYKTGTRRPIKEQLEIYAIPFNKGKKQLPISFRVICPDRESHYLWTLSLEEVNESSRRIIDIVRVILDDTKFKPNSSSGCKNCQIGNVCKYKGKESMSATSNRLTTPELTRLSHTYEWKPNEAGRAAN